MYNLHDEPARHNTHCSIKLCPRRCTLAYYIGYVEKRWPPKVCGNEEGLENPTRGCICAEFFHPPAGVDRSQLVKFAKMNPYELNKSPVPPKIKRGPQSLSRRAGYVQDGLNSGTGLWHTQNSLCGCEGLTDSAVIGS